jgi:hypothetical protein
MANVSQYFASWVGAGSERLNPGQAHFWWMVGFNYGDAISVTAHPVIGPPSTRTLKIEDVRIEGVPTGRTLLFTVRNVGPDPIIAYGIGFGFIRA